MKRERKMCPSAPFKKGHLVLGEFVDNRFVTNEELTKVDSVLFETVVNENNKKNYRTIMPCAQKGCGNWNGSKCTVPDQMKHFLSESEKLESETICPIMDSCRWYFQDGKKACEICPLIRTDFDFYAGSI